MKDTIVTGCDTPKKKKKVIKIAESLGFENDNEWNKKFISGIYFDDQKLNEFVYITNNNITIHSSIGIGCENLITYKEFKKKHKPKKVEFESFDGFKGYDNPYVWRCNIGSYKGKGLMLDGDYNWSIVTDDLGSEVLQAVKKQG